MGLNEPDEEDIAGSGGVCQWTTVNQDRDQCKDLVGQSHLLLVTVEYTSEENVSEKSQKFAKDSSNLVPNISLLGQQLNLLQSCSNDQYSILHYSNSYENNRDSNDAEGDIDEAAMSETQLLLFKNEIDVQSKNSIILPKSNNPESFVPNNVLITPLPETVVNTDLTNEIVKDSSSMVPSSSEMVRQEVNLSETDYSPGLNNVETHGNNEWDSDSSSEDEVRQVIVDKPVTCRAVASLPANFLSIDKIDGSLGDTFVGVFTTKEIPKRTQFGPVEGVLLSDEKSSVVLTASPFLELLIEQECGKMSRMDVSNEHLSNWMRYVRPAKNVEEQNLIISQHGKSLYYTTTRLIRAKEELKVWYSITYASTRGLPLLFSDSKRNVDTIGTLGVYEDYKNGNHQCQNQKTLKKVNSDLDNNNLVPKYNLRNYQDIYKLNQSKTKLFSLRKERNWRCSYCQRCFSNPTLLNLHTLTHAADTDSSDQIDIHCSRCSQDDKDKIEQENKPLNCSVCSKRFYTNSALICHVKTHKDDRKFECPICNQVFDKVLGLKAHVHSHSTNGYYSCSHCSKKYVEYKLIRKHIRTFHCGKNHKCINCSKKFPTLDKLRIHELSHSEHRQFLCANCGKQFKRKDKLSEHMRKIHYPDKEKISTTPRQKHPKNFVPKVLGNVSGYTQFVYKCHICIVGFKRRGMLVNHLANRHPDISPDSVPELNLPILKATKDYYCQYCDKIYKSSSKRKAHILKNHPGAKLPLSNKQMSTVSSLPGQENGTYSQTVGSVTTNPQGCQWCHKQYASKAKLLQHQRNKHSHLLPKSLQKPKKSIPADCGVQMISERCDGEKATEGSLILQGSLSNDTSEFGIKENDNPCFTEGEFIIDAPTLKKALRDEVITAECLPESIVELGQLIADSRPDQFFKVIQTPSGITYAQPIEIWDPLSSCQSLSPSDLDTSPFLTPYTGR